MGGINVAVVDDAQRSHQLFFCPLRTPSIKGEGGQGIDSREAAEVAAVIALHAPDGCDDLGRNAVAPAGSLQGRFIFPHFELAGLDTLGRDRRVQVLPGRASELRL